MKPIAANQATVEVINQPVPGMNKILEVLAQTIEHSIFPLVRSMDKKLDIDLRTHAKMNDISRQLKSLESDIEKMDVVQKITVKKPAAKNTKKE